MTLVASIAPAMSVNQPCNNSMTPAVNDIALKTGCIFCLAYPTTDAATKNTPMRPLIAATAISTELPSVFEPVRNVTKDYPPTLLIHGTSDTDVPFEQSQMMAEQFKKHEVPFQLVPIANGEHGFGGGSRNEIEKAYATMREFIVKHLSVD